MIQIYLPVFNKDSLCLKKCLVFFKYFILGSSPVFLNMFTTEMKEGKEGRVEIHDFNKETVERMINWMYTGQVEMKNVDFKGHCDLFR